MGDPEGIKDVGSGGLGGEGVHDTDYQDQQVASHSWKTSKKNRECVQYIGSKLNIYSLWL